MESHIFCSEDLSEEKRLFQALRSGRDFIIASGLRFRQAFFAISIGQWDRAREYVQLGDTVRSGHVV